jgi:branched-chain amino acid transport system substrate-binding protein
MTVRPAVGLTALFGVVALVASCSSGGGSKTGGANAGSPITVINVADFSGPQAFSGKFSEPSLRVACDEINKAGGVLGHSCKVQDVDDHSDPADGALALRQALAANHSVVAVAGLVTQTANAEVPLVVGSKIVAFALSGDGTFLHPTTAFGANAKYLYMIDPADEELGYGLAFAAKKLGLAKPAVVFTDTPDSKPVLDGVTKAAAIVGLTPSIVLPVAGGQSSYGTEVQRVVGSHPDGLIFELTPSDAGTFLGNLATAMGTINIPMITDENSLTKDFTDAVDASVGSAKIQPQMHVVGYPPSPENTPGLVPLATAYPTFDTRIPFTSGQQGPVYDAIILTALAMLDSKSIKPEVFGPHIADLTTKQNDDRVRVDTYAQGKDAIAAGKKIAYFGAYGPLGWTKDHVRVSGFVIGKWTPAKEGGATSVPEGTSISAQEVISALKL